MKASRHDGFIYKNDLRVKYDFIDKYYNSDLSERGKEAKAFFYTLCREIFKKNLEIYDRSGITFPIVYGERCAYSSISASLHDMGYAHMSEWGVRAKFLNSEANCKRRRLVDFWAWKENKAFWLEFKFLWFNLGGKVAFQEQESIVLKAIEQAEGIQKEGTKIALCNISLWIGSSINISIDELKKKRDENIESFLKIKGIQKERVLCAVLDFSECYQDYIFYDDSGKDKTPYVLIFGVVYP